MCAALLHHPTQTSSGEIKMDPVGQKWGMITSSSTNPEFSFIWQSCFNSYAWGMVCVACERRGSRRRGELNTETSSSAC